MFGVTSIADVFITNVLPVPVCDATAVALPTLVIGPVRLALVITVFAVKAVVAVVAKVAVAALPPILRFATGVVEVTTSGAVPSAIVEITWLPVTFPVNARDVPVDAPMFGVTSVGDVFITNVLPVPVCDATDVALPTLVIGPVKLAFVTTVVALPTLVTIPVKLALVVTVEANVAVAALPPILRLSTGVVDVTTNGAVPVATVEVT